MKNTPFKRIVTPLGLLVVALLLAAGTTTAAKADEEKVTVKLAGTIVKKTKSNGKPKWFIKFPDGQSFKIRTPRDSAGFKLDDYIGKTVILSFRATVTMEGDKRKVQLQKTFPVAVEEPKEGQPLPARDPDLELPGINKPKQ